MDWWQKKNPDLLLRDGSGEPVNDEAWGEALLDTSTAAKRTRLAKIVGGWIDGCAKAGFQAVEPDNLDSYERSGGRLTKAHNAAFAKLLATRAHAAGLAIGQKNTTDLLGQRKSIGFDFAVAEECGRYDECADYATAYGNNVIVIEYADTAHAYTRPVPPWATKISVIQRDLDVAARGREGVRLPDLLSEHPNPRPEPNTLLLFCQTHADTRRIHDDRRDGNAAEAHRRGSMTDPPRCRHPADQ